MRVGTGMIWRDGERGIEGGIEKEGNGDRKGSAVRESERWKGN